MTYCLFQGFAFINYASFEASDAAIEAMNSQVSHNKRVQLGGFIFELMILLHIICVIIFGQKNIYFFL